MHELVDLGLACSLEGKSLMAQLTQDKRLAELHTPLGKEVLVLASFVATEGLSELFEVNVETLSERESINFNRAIGRACTIKQTTYDNKIRYYNGILTATRRTGSTADPLSLPSHAAPVVVAARPKGRLSYLSQEGRSSKSFRRCSKRRDLPSIPTLYSAPAATFTRSLLRPVSRNRSGVLQSHDGSTTVFITFRARRRQAHAGDGERADVPQEDPGSADAPVHPAARGRNSYQAACSFMGFRSQSCAPARFTSMITTI